MKKLINDLPNTKTQPEEYSTEQVDIMSKYRVDSTGLYKPLGTEKSSEDTAYEIYPAKILEWKIEKFPKNKEEEKALKYYTKHIDDNTLESFNKLKKELCEITKRKDEISYKLNLVRLSCGLNDKSIFLWEKELEKSKIKTDDILNMNTIKGGIVNISTKAINDINIRQDRYTMLTKCD